MATKLNLTQASPYFKVPARSRKQNFLAYRIINDVSNEIKNFQKNFKYHYYLLDERKINNQNQDAIIVIPLIAEIGSEELDTFDHEAIDNNFKRMMYGESFRSRSQQVKFTEYNQKDIDAQVFTIDNTPHFDIKVVISSLKKYMTTMDFIQRQKNDRKMQEVLMTLANDVYKGIYSHSDLDKILDILETVDKKIKNKYQSAENQIKQSSSIRNSIGHFGDYIQLYQGVNRKTKTLADQLLSMMSADFSPSPKLSVAEAGELIASVYNPSLLKLDGTDHDNVVIYDSLKGMWIHNEDDFMALLNAVKPYASRNNLQAMIDAFAAQARNQGNFIEPYSESRYLLFTNCVLDVKTMKAYYQLNSQFIKDKHFTERMRINVAYNPDVIDPPTFPGERRADGGEWDPETFFMAYADNDPDKYQYFMFGLALGMFSGHNFGVHFNIRGESRWGKSTLANIYRAMYPGQVIDIVFSKLNEQFGLTNYQSDTSVIWVRECNTEADPLNSDYGTTTYDGLADVNAQIQIKSKRDLTVPNPPQVYVDGTSYVKAEDMDTGPAGRTLPYKLPMEGDSNHSIKSLTDQAYAIHIDKLLHNETVLQWLINTMVKAYRNCLTFPNEETKNRLWNLKITLNGVTGGDNQIFPAFVRNWRKEMLQTQGDLSEWFDYEFLPYLSQDNDEPTQMHNVLAYGLYSNSYQSRYGRQDPASRFMLNQKSFERQFDRMLEQAGWTKSSKKDARGNKTRKSIKYFSKTRFDVDRYKNDGNKVPQEFTNENIDKEHPQYSPFPLAQRTSGWYELIYNQSNNNNGKD